MKVYELARDLKMRSVDLIDKLRKEWKIPVKNHMQKLSEQEMQKIQNFLQKSKPKTVKKQKATPPKKTTSKKTTPKKVVAKKVTPNKKVTSSKKPIVQKKTTITHRSAPNIQPSIATPEPVSEKPLPALRTGIIRRKKIPTQPIASPYPSKDKATTTNIPKKELEVKPDALAGRNIRSGLISSESTDVFKKINESIEFSEQEKEKKKIKKITTDKDNQSWQFRATDFRKREMIFQPKKKRLSIGLSSKKTQITKPKAHKRVIKIHDTISLTELSHQLGVKKYTLIKKIKMEKLLEDQKTIPENIDYDTTVLVASLFDFEVKNLSKTTGEIIESLVFGNLNAKKQNKPPVVTIMGHVNHGKTTLLDYIRKSHTAQEEAGGITQHIGAYSVPVKDGFVTFIDTPGHSAFTAMRARGAQVTDIVVIMVAGDDGIQPQTIEAINHAKSAKAPIIVAINKVDLPSVDIDRVKKQIMEQGLVPEEWGGDTIFCPISARTGKGIPELLEQIYLLAEVYELKANPERSAMGVVLESRLQKGRGWVMSVLIQDGTLKTGQVLVTGQQIGRVRQITNDKGQIVSSALPGHPVEISGFNESGAGGGLFYVAKNEKIARHWLSQQKNQTTDNKSTSVLSSEELLLKAHNKSIKTLNIVLKTDVTGSREAIKYSLEKLNTTEVEAKIIHSNLGVVNENDVLLASAGQAIILCFNVGIDPKARKLITAKNITVKSYNIIYDLLTEIEKMMAHLLDPEIKEIFGGRATVQQVFQISNAGTIAGCRVIQGKITNNHFVRVMRKEEESSENSNKQQIVYEAKITSLKQLKQSVKNVSEGEECGIGLGAYKNFQVGDILESFTKKEIKKEKL